MPEKSLDELIADLESDNIEIRKFSYTQMAKFEDERIPQLLIAALKNPDIRFNVLWAIHFRHLDIANNNYYDPRAIPESPQYVQPLIDLLNENKTDDTVVAHTLVPLAVTQDARAVEIIASYIDNPNQDIRESAAEALGYTRDNRAIPYLLKALRDRDPRVRWVATTAIARFDSLEAIKGLINALTDTGHLYPKMIGSVNPAPVGEIAQMWLIKKGDLAFNALIDTFTDQNASRLLRACVGTVLTELGDNRAVEHLVSTLDEMLDHDPALWRKSTEALAKLGELRAIEVLSRQAENDHSRLGIIGAVAKTAIEQIRIANETDINKLLPYLKDGYFYTEFAARERLKKLGYTAK